MYKVCRGISKINPYFPRILFRKRFYSSLEIRIPEYCGLESSLLSQNDLEQFQILNRCTRYLESDLAVESLDFNDNLNLCEKVSEVCQLFSENSSNLSVNQLLLMLSRIIQINSICLYSKSVDYDCEIEPLDASNMSESNKGFNYFPANKFCQIPLDNLKGVNVKRLDARVIEIFMKLINKVAQMDREQILYLNRMCKYIKGYHTKLILRSSEDSIGPYISQMEPVDMIRIAMSISSKSENVEFVKIYISELFKKIDLLKKSEKMLIFETMAKSKKCSSLFLLEFSEYLSSKIGTEEETKTEETISANEAGSKAEADDNFSENEYIKFLLVYSKNQKCISKHLFKYLFSKCLVVDFNKLSLSNVLDLVWISNKFNNVDMFLPKVMGLLTQKINQMGPESLTMLIWSYSNSSLENEDFYKILEQAAIDVSRDLTTKNIAMCAYCLSLKRAVGWESRFHNHIQDDVVANIRHFNGLDLAMLAYAYSRALCGSNILHQCIQESALNYVDELPADCISKLLVSYARISGKKSLFSSFMTSFLQRMHQFPIHEFIQVMWAYLVMKFYETSFWSTCLEVVVNNFDQIVSDNRCYLLYPVLKIITQLDVVPPSSDLTRLMNHTKKYFWASQQKNKTSELVSSVVKLVEGVENVKFNHDIDTFLVDVCFFMGGTDYALLIYNNSNTFKQTPIGDLKLKELYLVNKGYQILRLNEHIWINSDIDAQVAIISSQIK